MLVVCHDKIYLTEGVSCMGLGMFTIYGYLHVCVYVCFI